MNTKQPMEWTHSQTIGLSNIRCAKCEGTGLQPGLHRDGKSPCNCVLRNIFRSCLKRFYFCADNEPYRSKVVLMPCQGYDVNCTWTRTSEDYMADFYLVAKRILTEDEFRIFRFHFLQGADWKLCCRRLGTDKGTFFHSVYRIVSRSSAASTLRFARTRYTLPMNISEERCVGPKCGPCPQRIPKPNTSYMAARA